MTSLDQINGRPDDELGNRRRVGGRHHDVDVAHRLGEAADRPAGLGDIDKRSIEISAPVKSVGRHEATVRLRTDVLAALTLEVVAAK